MCLFDPYPADGEQQRRLGLKEAEHIALKNNFELRMLRAERGINNENIKGRLRDRFPSVSVSYRQNRTVARRDFDQGRYSVQLSVSQPVYDGGRSKLAYEIAKIDAKMARSQYWQNYNQTRFSVRQAYLRLQQQRGNISVSRAGMESARALFSRSSMERKQGEITELDFREVENEFARRKLTLKQEEEAYGDALIDFRNLLRLPEGGTPEIKLLDLYNLEVKTIDVSPEELYNLAVKNRPDVKQSQIDLARSRREYLISKYSYLPNVSLTGNYGKTGEEWPPRTTEWGVGINFTFNFLGNTLRNDAQLQRSRENNSRGVSTSGSLDIFNNAAWRQPHMQNKIQLQRNKQSKADLIRDVKLQIERAHRGIRDRQRALKLSDEGLAIRELRNKVERKRMIMGELSLSEYLEEEIQLIQARLQLIQERVDFALAVNQLEMDLGLELDTLELLNLKELTPQEEVEGIRRLWRPKTEIMTPGTRQSREADVREARRQRAGADTVMMERGK